MGVLSQYIERAEKDGGAGIATVQVSLIRPVTEAVRPPRALWVPFPFGRPLGPPNRPDVQLDVLRQTLGLVDQPTAPALIDYPDNVNGDDIPSEEGWSCPVTFPTVEPNTQSEYLKAQLRTEAQLLGLGSMKDFAYEAELPSERAVRAPIRSARCLKSW